MLVWYINFLAFPYVLCWQILFTRGNLGVTELTWNDIGDVHISEMLINTAWRMNLPQYFGEITSLYLPLSLFIPPFMSQPPRITRGKYKKRGLRHRRIYPPSWGTGCRNSQYVWYSPWRKLTGCCVGAFLAC